MRKASFRHLIVATLLILVTTLPSLEAAKFKDINRVYVSSSVDAPDKFGYYSSSNVGLIGSLSVLAVTEVYRKDLDKMRNAMIKSGRTPEKMFISTFKRKLKASGLYQVTSTSSAQAEFRIKITSYGLDLAPTPFTQRHKPRLFVGLGLWQGNKRIYLDNDGSNSYTDKVKGEDMKVYLADSSKLSNDFQTMINEICDNWIENLKRKKTGKATSAATKSGPSSKHRTKLGTK